MGKVGEVLPWWKPHRWNPVQLLIPPCFWVSWAKFRVERREGNDIFNAEDLRAGAPRAVWDWYLVSRW